MCWRDRVNGRLFTTRLCEYFRFLEHVLQIHRQSPTPVHFIYLLFMNHLIQRDRTLERLV